MDNIALFVLTELVNTELGPLFSQSNLFHHLPLTHYIPGYFIQIPKMGSIVNHYHVNIIGREYNWTSKDCPQMRTVGYDGLRHTKGSVANYPTLLSIAIYWLYST